MRARLRRAQCQCRSVPERFSSAAGKPAAAPCNGPERSHIVAAFRIFYFRHSVLDHAEEVEARDLLAAVQKLSGTPSDLSVEIWSDKGKVGIVGPTRGGGKHPLDFVTVPRRRRLG
jgi:hypothetical protein